MILDINVHLHYRLAQPTDLLMQLEAADGRGQRLVSANINLSETEYFSRVAAEDSVGERIWLRCKGDFLCDYSARIDVRRPAPEIGSLDGVAPHLLPAEAVRYLMPSRYCPSDELQSFVAAEFGQLSGGARIAAMRDWIGDKFQYVPGLEFRPDHGTGYIRAATGDMPRLCPRADLPCTGFCHTGPVCQRVCA